ncbi:hypothetical protein DTS71_10645 [Salmonella enterica]|nr:hypothetical protein [Salmonella enterica]
MFAIRPNDFYRCIMSPNMMLARTRPLPIQQGPFFLLHISSRSSVGRLAHPGHVATRGFAALPPCCNLNYFGETVLYVTVIRQSITVYAQSAPRAAGRGSLPPSCCDRSGQENRPATR